MKVIIGNTVKTDRGSYVCNSREEAEALLLTLRELDDRRTLRPAQRKLTRSASRQTTSGFAK